MSKEMAETTQNYTISVEHNPKLMDSLFSKDLAPHYMNLAGKLASSALVPKSYQNKPQDLFIAWAMGYQLGLSPEQSMQSIAVINGRACMWGDDMLALCMTHPDFEDMREEPIIDKDGAVTGYTCTVKRRGKLEKSNVFTLEMAKKAGLLAKGGPWVQYTERMLKLRARGFTLRDAFPDALNGIKPREEVEDYNENLSRTEILKTDYLTKKGHKNDIPIIEGTPVTPSGTFIHSTNTLFGAQEEERNNNDGMDLSCETEDKLHDKIKELLREKQFTDERLTKALAYYEVDNVDEINAESALHFIEQLNKL